MWYCASEKSCAPPPVPSTTPISRFCARDIPAGSRPASCSASAEAATARGTERETCLRSRASIQSSSLKSWISPAIFTGRSEVLKRVMSLTPLLPSSTARQNAVFPSPFGLTTPMPVITARLSIDSDSIIDAGFPHFCGPFFTSSVNSGIYISVPFCRSKCTYCNFASGVFSAGQMGRYVERVIEDVQAFPAYVAHLGAAIPEAVDSIYLGGGTPSLLPPAELKKLFSALRREFNVMPSAEVTVECAPGTLNNETIQTLATLGVNRVSLGVQSFVDNEAASVARLHTREKTLSDIERLRGARIANINVDLIAGLPHQTRESWEYSLEQAIATGVPHLSVYMLEVDEDSRLGRELIAGGAKYHAHFVPDDDRTAEFYETACERLNAAGIAQYEISNFARAGLESQHNLKYWTRQPYAGFGVDAHSMLAAGDGS